MIILTLMLSAIGLTQGFLFKRHCNRAIFRTMNSYKDKSDFYSFYEETVPFGSEMSLNQFLTHPYIEDQLMLTVKQKSEKGLSLDKISDVWIDLWSCNCMCISEEKAYQTLCALFDQIEIDSSV